MWLIKNWNSSTIGGKEYTLVDEAGLRVMVNNDEDVPDLEEIEVADENSGVSEEGSNEENNEENNT